MLIAKSSAEVALAALRARIAPFVRVHDGKPLGELHPPDSVGCTFDREHVDWPSFPRYDFAFSPDTGLHAVCGGALPVFRTRVLHDTAGRCHWSSEWMLPNARASWLVHLLGKEQAEAVRAIDQHRLLRWRDADSYPADMRALRAEVEADWRKVIALCIAAKVITAEAAKVLAPEIELGEWNLLDEREDRSVPLPDRTAPPRAR